MAVAVLVLLVGALAPSRSAAGRESSDPGVLTQKAGTAGCIHNSGNTGQCVDGNSMSGMSGVAVSADGKSVYAVGDQVVAVFDRNTTTGVLTQKAGTAGCIHNSGNTGQCVDGNSMSGMSGVAVSADGKSVYAVGDQVVAVFDRVLPPTAPSPPTGVAAAVVGPTTARVTFTAGSNGGSPITGFQAECTSSTGGATRQRSGVSSPIDVLNLSNGHTYRCRVRATNAVGTSAYSGDSAAVLVAVGIRGTVSESGTGLPLAGAWVAIMNSSDFSIAAGVVADVGGAFLAPDVDPGTYYLYVVDPSGAHTSGFHGGPAAITVNAGQVTTVNPARSSLRGSITGTVTGSGGAPIAGAWGLALSAGAANAGATERIVTANGSGVLSLSGLVPGNHFVGFVDPSGAHTSRFHPGVADVPSATPVGVTAGSVSSVNATLPAQTAVGTGAVVSGTITSATTGAPVPGARVVALRASDFSMARGAVSDTNGAYSLNLAAGGYKLAVLDSAGAHAMEWHDDQPSTGLGSATTVVAPATVNAALTPTVGSVTGVVTDDTASTPIPGVWVVAIGPSGMAGGAVTSATGSFTINGLAPGSYLMTFVDPNGGREQEYHDDSTDVNGATPVAVIAGGNVTVNAALGFP